MTIERITDETPAHLYDEEARALRDQFAGQAMNAMMIGYYTHDPVNEAFNKMATKADLIPSAWLSREAYKVADAMIAASEVKP